MHTEHAQVVCEGAYYHHVCAHFSCPVHQGPPLKATTKHEQAGALQDCACNRVILTDDHPTKSGRLHNQSQQSLHQIATARKGAGT